MGAEYVSTGAFMREKFPSNEQGIWVTKNSYPYNLPDNLCHILVWVSDESRFSYADLQKRLETEGLDFLRQHYYVEEGDTFESLAYRKATADDLDQDFPSGSTEMKGYNPEIRPTSDFNYVSCINPNKSIQDFEHFHVIIDMSLF